MEGSAGLHLRTEERVMHSVREPSHWLRPRVLVRLRTSATWRPSLGLQGTWLQTCLWGARQRDSAGATCDRTRTACGNTKGIQCPGNGSAGNGARPLTVRDGRWNMGKGRAAHILGRWIRIGDIGVNLWLLTEKEISTEFPQVPVYVRDMVEM